MDGDSSVSQCDRNNASPSKDFDCNPLHIFEVPVPICTRPNQNILWLGNIMEKAKFAIIPQENYGRYLEVFHHGFSSLSPERETAIISSWRDSSAEGCHGGRFSCMWIADGLKIWTESIRLGYFLVAHFTKIIAWPDHIFSTTFWTLSYSGIKFVCSRNRGLLYDPWIFQESKALPGSIAIVSENFHI